MNSSGSDASSIRSVYAFPLEVAALRVGIIGTGATAHVDAFDALNGRTSVVDIDIDEARAREFAAAHGIASVYGTAERLDLVSICTPPGAHLALATLAVEAGVVRVVEKPTVLRLAEMTQLVDLEAASGVPILTIVQHRFGGSAVFLRELFERGERGRPRIATCDTLWFRPDKYYAVPWRGLWDIEDAGPTMGLVIHKFDMLLFLLGDWRDGTAVAARQLRSTDTEDVSAAIVRFADGAIASVVNSAHPGRRATCASTSRASRSRSSTSTATPTPTGRSRPHLGTKS
ncbi:MAG: Gfo/Idh/MocA family oxidoreductase [Microbacterium sp.]